MVALGTMATSTSTTMVAISSSSDPVATMRVVTDEVSRAAHLAADPYASDAAVAEVLGQYTQLGKSLEV